MYLERVLEALKKMFLLMFLAAVGLSCGTWYLYLQHLGSSSLTRDQTAAPCTGSMDHQPSPHRSALFKDCD